MPEKRSWWRVLAILPLIAATLGIASVVRDWREPETLITIAPLPTEAGSVTVYVGGAVSRPCLYTLPSG